VKLVNENNLLSLAWQIVDQLEAVGHAAYLVGGFVRDQLLGRKINDIDIATSALPEQVMALFKRAEPTGLQHGTITVIEEGIPFEVTTFRCESDYIDGRRPEKVHFIEDLAEDLSRRDFTMNAMALGRQLELIDPYGGRDDLRLGRIRCVGQAERRFSEDALRMLRCIRFAAEYGLTVERESWLALLGHAASIAQIAMERVRSELERIVEGSGPLRGLRLLAESKLTDAFKAPFFVDVNRLFATDKSELLTALETIDKPQLRWPFLYLVADVRAEQAARWMRSWTFPTWKIQESIQIVSLHEAIAVDSSMEALEHRWKIAVLQFGPSAAERWFELIAKMNRMTQLQNKTVEVLLIHGQSWLSNMPITSMNQLAVSGKELMEEGFPSGPKMGKLLRRLLEAVALGDVTNERSTLMPLAKRLWSEEE